MFSCLLTEHPFYIQGIISTFKSYYWRNTFCKALTNIGCDSSNGSGQNKLKDFWKGFTILGAIENILDWWGEPKYQHSQEFGRNWFQPSGITERAQDFNGEVIADMIEVTGELELEVEVEDVVELLQSWWNL